jgi:hypothetical protein
MTRAALKAETPKLFSAASEIVSALVASSRSKWELLIVDLESVPDAGRLIDFIKSSAPIRAIRVLVVGTAAQLTALGSVSGGSADATVEAPCGVAEIAAAVAKLREDLSRPEKGGARGPNVRPGGPPPANP